MATTSGQRSRQRAKRKLKQLGRVVHDAQLEKQPKSVSSEIMHMWHEDAYGLRKWTTAHNHRNPMWGKGIHWSRKSDNRELWYPGKASELGRMSESEFDRWVANELKAIANGTYAIEYPIELINMDYQKANDRNRMRQILAAQAA